MFCVKKDNPYICALSIGRLTQRFRVLPLQGRSRRFESCIAHFNPCKLLACRDFFYAFLLLAIVDFLPFDFMLVIRI